MKGSILASFALAALVGCGAGDHDRLRDENARLRAQLAGRQAASAPAEDDEPAPPFVRRPTGGIFVPHGEAAELGWATLRVTAIRPCEHGRFAIELAVENLAAKDVRIDFPHAQLF